MNRHVISDLLFAIIFISLAALTAILVSGCATPPQTKTELESATTRSTTAGFEAGAEVGGCAVVANRCGSVSVFSGRAAVEAAGNRTRDVSRNINLRRTE